MTDHIQGRSNDGRMTSSWYGRNRRVKLKALDKDLEYAEDKPKKFCVGVDFLKINPHINSSDNVQYKKFVDLYWYIIGKTMLRIYRCDPTDIIIIAYAIVGMQILILLNKEI